MDHCGFGYLASLYIYPNPFPISSLWKGGDRRLAPEEQASRGVFISPVSFFLLYWLGYTE